MLGVRQGSFKSLLPVLPRAVERLPVTGHDLVISSSSAFAHGVRVDPDAVHVCYCYTPFRYAWYEQDAGIRQVPSPLRPLLRRSLDRIRKWDFAAAQRDTHYVAISRLSQERIRRYWGREAPIVHPPVELDRFSLAEPQDYFLIVSELVTHKQVDLALRAARRARVPIKVVGGGVDAPRLRAEHDDHAEFLGRVDDEHLARLFAGARALVVPNIEEFGITAVEAQASGRPVIAADGGGARETVVDGGTGLFFEPENEDALTARLLSRSIDSLRPEDAIASARRFSVSAFRDGFAAQVERARERRPSRTAS